MMAGDVTICVEKLTEFITYYHEEEFSTFPELKEKV